MKSFILALVIWVVSASHAFATIEVNLQCRDGAGQVLFEGHMQLLSSQMLQPQKSSGFTITGIPLSIRKLKREDVTFCENNLYWVELQNQRTLYCASGSVEWFKSLTPIGVDVNGCDVAH